MWLMLAKASPLNPYVSIADKSSKVLILEVVWRSQRIAKSSFCPGNQPCESYERGGRVIHLNSAAIVGDLEKLQAAILGHHIQGSSARIDGVLNELLESMDRSHNDLTGSDFIDDIWVKCLGFMSAWDVSHRCDPGWQRQPQIVRLPLFFEGHCFHRGPPRLSFLCRRGKCHSRLLGNLPCQHRP